MSVDTLIIGSGVAAAALAQRLLDKNPRASILILEAGSQIKMQDYALWENYVITGRLPYAGSEDLPYPDRDHPGENLSIGSTEVPLNGARAMIHGGSTMHWGGWSFRLKPEDFQLKSNTGQSLDWPFDYQHLEPYYGQAEHYIGVSGDSEDRTVFRSKAYPFPFFPYTLEDKPTADALRSLGIAYGHLPIARHGMTNTVSRHAPCQTTGTCKYCPFGARYVATNFLNDLVQWQDVPHFHVQLNAIVQELVMGSRQTATGVIYLNKETGKRETIEARRIIVAAGSIESAKLLLRSTSSYWPKGVGNDHELVGRNLVTHPYFIFSGTLKTNPLKLQPEMNFPTLCSRHFDSPSEQNAGKFILINPPGTPTTTPSLVAQMQGGKTREQIDAALTGQTSIQLHGMLEIFSRHHNRVMNHDRTNHLGMMETVVDYSKDVGFDQRMAEIQAHVARIFEKMGATMVGKPSISWRADHAACVCRMSKDETMGVIDENLRIHGLDNVYVCSNAAFPSIGAVNPTLTLTALALRLGDHLSTQGS